MQKNDHFNTRDLSRSAKRIPYQLDHGHSKLDVDGVCQIVDGSNEFVIIGHLVAQKPFFGLGRVHHGVVGTVITATGKILRDESRGSMEKSEYLNSRSD